MRQWIQRVSKSTLNGWEKSQLPFATAKALTLTGQKVKAGITSAMQRSFSNPTPYTLNSVYLKPATKTNLVAEVELKNWASKERRQAYTWHHKCLVASANQNAQKK